MKTIEKNETRTVMYIVLINKQKDSRTVWCQLDYSTAILLLNAAYISSICGLYGHICKARVCVCVYTNRLGQFPKFGKAVLINTKYGKLSLRMNR